MADTKELNVVSVARSDGADTGPGYWPAPASSSAQAAAIKKGVKDAAEKMPRPKPQMIRLDHDDPRFVEWRVKLGILLKQELAPEPDEGLAWYVPFPRGYWLYEKSKHLWVSGYPIKSKLFKTPQEFALHLIWLFSSSNDYKDCCCVHCNIPSVPKVASTIDDNLTITPKDSPVKSASAKSSARITPVPVPALPVHTQPTASKPSPSIQAAQLAQPHAPSAQPNSRPGQPQTQSPAVSQASPHSQQAAQARASSVTPSPRQASAQPVAASRRPPIPEPKRLQWGLKSSYLFRLGELTWFQNGNTWRLGIITNSSNAGHELLPISYGTMNQTKVVKTDQDMRPFYAFSVPPATLDELKPKAFDEIAWDNLFMAASEDPQRRDLVALDASKLAASKIDISFSLWGSSKQDTSGRISYYGAFMGAERIEIGDTLRVKSLPFDTDVNTDRMAMGMYYMYTPANAPQSVLFFGNLYYLTTPADERATFVTDDYLPLALRDEMQWRQKAMPESPLRWALLKEDVMLEERSIRGRFYPTQRLWPILNPGGWQQAMAQGQLPHLNTRLDGGNGRYIGRRTTRVETFGAAVAHGARVALESHVKEDGS